jgi:HSP20 family protein
MTNLPKKFNNSLMPRSIFDPWFSEFFSDDYESPFRNLLESHMRWDERMGSIDFEKTEKEYTVLVDVPGLTKEDIKVDIDGGVMTVSAERKPREKKEGVEYLASERSYRRFSRSFSLPEDVDLEKTDAKVENGVLTMTIGRKVNKKSAKTVEIK